MSGIDYAIIAVVSISLAFGLWRGFVKEALSLVIWVGAFFLSYSGADLIAPVLESVIAEQALRVAVSFVSIFLLVHIVGFFVSKLLANLIKSIGLSSVDRIAGAGFGFLRGFIIVSVVVLLVGMTPIKDSPQWASSGLVPLVGEALGWIQERYPLDLQNGLTKVMS